MAGAAAVALAIKVSADASQAKAELNGATQTVSKVGKAGQAAGKLLAAGLVVAAGAAVKFTQAAGEDAQAAAQLAQTAQKAAGATAAQTAAMEDWIAAQGRAKGVADDELRPAMSKLITATKDVAEAQKLASLAMDISARSGKSLDSVSQSLAKAQNGSVAGLGKYGVATKDAAGNTKSLAQVQADLAKSYGGASAAAADTAAGKAKILAVQMDELQESIGTKLLPVMTKLTSAGLGVVDWISQNQTAALAIIGVLGGLLAIVKAVSLATQVWAAVTKIQAAAQVLLNVAMSANPVVLIVIAIVALVAALVLAYKKSETFRNIVNAAFSAVAAVASAVWAKIQAGGTAALGAISKAWPVVKAVITGPFTAAKTVIDGVWDKITTAFEKAKGVLETTASAVQTAVKGAFDAIATAIQAVISKVETVIEKIKSIPKPNLGPLGGVLGRTVGRSGGGLGLPVVGRGSLPATGSQTITINVRVDGFVGNDQDIAARLAGPIGNALRRRGVAMTGQA